MTMERIELRFEDVRYPYLLGTDCFGELVTELAALDASSFVIVADDNVAPLHGEELRAALARHATTHLLVHADGEVNKTLVAVQTLGGRALELGADRRSVVVALGGGLTGNLAGVLSALLFRGVRLVHVPTTLLAMMDSVLSLKQAVNDRQGKNLLGMFHTPVLAVSDTRYLRTLPARQIRAGFCEVIKNALAICPAHIEPLRALLRPSACYTDAELSLVIKMGIEAKQHVMEGDKFERGKALLFEYGHTVGHAIEHAARGALPHGEAVGLGMLVAAHVSHELGHLDRAGVELHEALVRSNGLVPALPADAAREEVLRLLRSDNKRGYLRLRSDEIAMILLDRVGQPHAEASSHPGLSAVPFELIAAVLDRALVPRDTDTPLRLMA
jgi:3-dehydroquinate synthase/2-deoxy-scyllo-inosose synthase